MRMTTREEELSAHQGFRFPRSDVRNKQVWAGSGRGGVAGWVKGWMPQRWSRHMPLVVWKSCHERGGKDGLLSGSQANIHSSVQ